MDIFGFFLLLGILSVACIALTLLGIVLGKIKV
jgi:hypothetical protein